MIGRKARNILCVTALTQLLLAFLLLYLLSAVPDESLGVGDYPVSRVIRDRNGVLLNVRTSDADEWCIPVSLDRTGRWTPLVVTAIEDKRFYTHNGVDPLALLRAAGANLRAGRVLSGASTITAQLIRISNPRERTLRTKLLEFLAAIRLEHRLTKDEILELYLNRAPFGGNIRGVEAASRIYFGKPASNMSIAEAALLVSLLKSPTRLRPDRFPERARIARDRNLRYLQERGVISRETLRISNTEIVAAKRHPLPRTAAMAGVHIMREHFSETTVQATLDARVQAILESCIQEAVRNLPSQLTASGIVVDNQRGEVLAYVGNARHGSALPGAQVDCGNSLRSPGSTLKPFLYAEAMRQGRITPMTLLVDTPLSFGGASPRNYDRQYRGPVSARTALSASLNAPAVRVLRMIGYAQGLITLRQLGFSHLTRESAAYADSLALGGCEVTLIELAAAYRALSQMGKYSPLKWRLSEETPRREVLSPEAAYLTLDILQDEKRYIPLYQELFRNKNYGIAFKTGTSYGLRDAWSAGCTQRYTVVIWFGTPSGIGDRRLVGLQTAAPVMLQVFRQILKDGEPSYTKPADVYNRRVCSLSGAVPGKSCPSTATDLAIRDVSSNALCELHKVRNGEVVVEWPFALRNWAQFHATHGKQAERVKILRPLGGSKILLPKGAQEQRLFLWAEGTPPLYWYLDGKFLKVDKDGTGVFVNVGKGAFRLSVLSGEVEDFIRFEIADATAEPSQKSDRSPLLNP